MLRLISYREILIFEVIDPNEKKSNGATESTEIRFGDQTLVQSERVMILAIRQKREANRNSRINVFLLPRMETVKSKRRLPLH